MNTHADKTQDSKSQTVVRNDYSAQSGSDSSFQFADNRAEATSQRKLNELANNSQNLKQAAQLKSFADSYPGHSIQKVGIEEEEPLQGKFIPVQRQGIEEEELLQGKFEPIQKKQNNTGLPDNLKSGIESLSGYSLDDVKVNYNSKKPAQLNAHAYAQGTDIHIASGQEKHLAHEAWHVVQQKQGRVKPTMQMKGHVNVNDDEGLEREADVMGAKAYQLKPNHSTEIVQRKSTTIQMVGGPNEFEDQGSLDDHFDKHVTNQNDAGGAFADGDAYELAAKAIVTGDYTETKTKGANTYYWKNSTGQFAVVRGGFVRSMFVPGAGKSYYDKQ